MKLIDRYVGYAVFSGIMIVLLILVGLFTFFSFIDELDDIGKHHYGITLAIQYVLLEIPRHVYDLFPTAALLGSLIGLGFLANNNELTVIRSAGVSVLRVAYSVTKMGFILTLVALLIGETLAPLSGQYAKNMRAFAQSKENYMAFNTAYGFWARDGNHFINIRTLLPNGSFGGVVLYEFDDNWRLKSQTYADTAYYEEDKNQWLLTQVRKTTIEPERVTYHTSGQETWNAILSPELVRMVVINPQKLSSLGLYIYIHYLTRNHQDASKYEQALWGRLSYPLVGLTMVFLAIPFVFGSLRGVSVSQRILMGALLGIGFHMINQIIGHVGYVYDLHPAISTFSPLLLFLSIAIIAMRRTI